MRVFRSHRGHLRRRVSISFCFLEAGLPLHQDKFCSRPFKWIADVSDSLNAILLGRLGLPIDKAIEMFERTAENMFQRRGGINLGGSRYKHREMEAALKDIVEAETGSSSTKLKSGGETGCKAQVSPT